MSLTDRDALLTVMDKLINPMPGDFGAGFLSGIASAISCVEDAPTIDAVPVVHGRWVNLGFIGDKEMIGCSECHCVSETKSDFCKDCGAKMDKEAPQ